MADRRRGAAQQSAERRDTATRNTLNQGAGERAIPTYVPPYPVPPDRPAFERPWWLRGYVIEAAIPVILTEAAAYVVAVGSSPVVRAPLVVAFVLWAPGAALCSLFGPKDRVARTVASVALSLALLILTAQTVLSVGAWSSNAVLVTLGALTVATSAAALVRNLARARGEAR